MSESKDKGFCCSCLEKPGEVNRLVNKKCPEGEMGWGCGHCGLPPEGAVAILCNDCDELFFDENMILRYVVTGEDGLGRYPYENLLVEFDHDFKKHPEFKAISRAENSKFNVTLELDVADIWVISDALQITAHALHSDVDLKESIERLVVNREAWTIIFRTTVNKICKALELNNIKAGSPEAFTFIQERYKEYLKEVNSKIEESNG